MKFRSLYAMAIVCCVMFCMAIASASAQDETQPRRQVQLTQEHLQIMKQIVQQMPPEKREQLQQLPREQQQAVLLQLLGQVLSAQQDKPLREWLQHDDDPSVQFVEPDQYPDTAERIEDFVHKKTEKRVEVLSLAFIRDGHDHFFKYKRLFRAKYKTRKSDEVYQAEFLLEKEGPYLKVKQWRRVKDNQPAAS